MKKYLWVVNILFQYPKVNSKKIFYRIKDHEKLKMIFFYSKKIKI